MSKIFEHHLELLTDEVRDNLTSGVVGGSNDPSNYYTGQEIDKALEEIHMDKNINEFYNDKMISYYKSELRKLNVKIESLERIVKKQREDFNNSMASKPEEPKNE